MNNIDIYADTSKPLVNFTRATFRIAEFGFLGVTIQIFTQIPFFCGQNLRAELFIFFKLLDLLHRIN